jgi:putative membrane protein
MCWHDQFAGQGYGSGGRGSCRAALYRLGRSLALPAHTVAVTLLLTWPHVAYADGTRAEPGRWWQAWDADPLVLLSLGLLAGLYGRGLARLWGKVGVGHTVRRWQSACFFGGLTVIFLALLSPLDALSAELSAMHMVQHMVLMTVAAPLFVLGSPSVVLAWGLPERTKGRGRSVVAFVLWLPQEPILWQPWFVWTLFAVTLWAWHHPALYQAALRDPLVHDAQHVSFFVAACLFWRACLDPLSQRRLSAPVAIPYLFATSVHASALGVFLALSPRVWYDDYAATTSAWGLTPMQDQQMAGLIMWMPACLIYPAVAAVLFGLWLSNLDAPRRQEVLAS